MRLPKMFGLLTASALLIGAPSAHALQLTLDDLSTAVVDVFIDDDIIGAGNPTAGDGDIDFEGSAGTFFAEVAIAEAAPQRGNAFLLESFLDYQVVSGADASTLVITLVEESVTLDTSSTLGQAIATSSIAIGEARAPGTSARTFIRIGMDEFTIDDSINNLVAPPFAVSNTDLLLTILPGQVFDIVTEITINHNVKGVQSNGSALVTVAPVPVPAALPLFLTALVGLGFIGRQRRRQAA